MPQQENEKRAFKEALVFLGLARRGKKLVDGMELEPGCQIKSKLYGYFLQVLGAMGNRHRFSELGFLDDKFEVFLKTIRQIWTEKSCPAVQIKQLRDFFEELRKICLEETAPDYPIT